MNIAYSEIKKLMLDKLQNDLPAHLTYHSVLHVKDVLQAVTVLAKSENVTDEDLLLLKTAAIFHDAGFLYGANEHEKKSCEIAKLYLPKYGYSAEQINKICGMIMATKIPQTPQNHLEEVLADADLDYLGREDFFIISHRLFEELSMLGIVSNEDDWNQLQIKFFESHRFFTPTSIKLRNQKKQEHLSIIKSKLKNNES